MMKKIMLLSLPIIAMTLLSFHTAKEEMPTIETEKVKWYSWEEAVEAAKTSQKKIFIDVYTDWCGWCKRMDQTTFKDAKVAKHLNDNFYPVKLDAEMKNDVVFRDHTFKFQQQGRRGAHELAYSLLNGSMTYPSYVILDENFNRVLIAPGYQKTPDFMNILEYASGDHFKNKTWQDYLKEVEKK